MSTRTRHTLMIVGATVLLVAGAGTYRALVPVVRTAGGGGWVQGWGNGTIASAVQPDTNVACDAAHQCLKTALGTSHAITLFGAGAPVGVGTFQASVQVDLPDATPNGSGQSCYPTTGQVSFTGVGGTLVLDIQGTDCALGSSTTLEALTGTYVPDAKASTGRYATATGTGAFHWSVDSSQSPPTVVVAIVGNLHFQPR